MSVKMVEASQIFPIIKIRRSETLSDKTLRCFFRLFCCCRKKQPALSKTNKVNFFASTNQGKASFLNLPDDCLYIVIQFLETKQLMSLSWTCKKAYLCFLNTSSVYNAQILSDKIWAYFLKKNFSLNSLNIKNAKNLYMQMILNQKNRQKALSQSQLSSSRHSYSYYRSESFRRFRSMHYVKI